MVCFTTARSRGSRRSWRERSSDIPVVLQTGQAALFRETRRTRCWRESVVEVLEGVAWEAGFIIDGRGCGVRETSRWCWRSCVVEALEAVRAAGSR